VSSTATVTIHQSQFPRQVQRDLFESLRTRRLNHKFHYDSIKQTNRWLALHQRYSPSRNDSDCAATYDRAFLEAVGRIKAKRVHVIGLGCGGGQKDTRLLKLLKRAGKMVSYTPSDVSVAMTLVAKQAANEVVPEKECFPLVCDLATADDLAAILATDHVSPGARLVTFFGMIPNFEPTILKKLKTLLGTDDWLLLSANLAPGADYADGVRRVLPQYDNALTREWLLGFLLDLGVERGDGELEFTIEDVKSLKRIVARFRFGRGRQVAYEGRRFKFRAGEVVRLFFSYRYQPHLIRGYLQALGIPAEESWITASGEEGVFLCRRQ
jgi:uncharacterized SAM-dependent methyltransferase